MYCIDDNRARKENEKNYDEFISMTMAGIIACVDREVIIPISGESYFVFFENAGFYIKKVKGMEEKIAISPHYLINILFNTFIGSSKAIIETTISKAGINEKSINFSFEELINLIEKIRTQNGNNAFSEDFLNLRNLLKKARMSPFDTFKQEIMSLLCMESKQVANIANDNPVLARKIERFYQVERLLKLYCKSEIAIYEGHIPVDYDITIDDELVLKDIKLSEYITNYNEYYLTLYDANSCEMENATDSYNRMEKTKRIGILGLEEIILPGNPFGYKETKGSY